MSRAMEVRSNRILEGSPVSRGIRGTLTMAFLTVCAILALAPLYWTLVSSFRTLADIFTRPTLLPARLTVGNYVALVKETNFLRWAFNSSFVAVCFTALGVFFCTLGGFAFAKYDFPFKTGLFWILLGSMMIPAHATLIPLFSLFARYRLVDTYWALIVPGSASGFGIFFMRQYIAGISSELIEAARIDGCTEFQIYHKVILPVIRPAIGALTVFLFMSSWNSYLSPLIFMRSPSMFTLPVGLAALFGSYNFKIEYGQIMAGAVLSVIPVAIVFIALQRQFIEGLTVGALKS